MGTVQVPGRVSGKTYNLKIKGDTPSDTERARILSFIEEKENAFIQKYEQEIGTPIPEPEDGTALGRGIARGIPAAKSTLGTTIETIGDKTGIASIADFGRGMEESAAQRQFELALSQPKPITRQDVAATEGFFPKIGAGLTYAGELAGSQIPQLGVGLAGGTAGAIGGFAVGSVPGAIAGFGIGSGLSEAPLLFGANVQRQEQEVAEGRKDAVDLGDALGATVGQAALTGIANAIGAKGLTLVRGGLFTRAAKGAALGAPVEGLNEVGQAVLERYQAGLPIDTPEAIQEYIDNGIAGGVLGGGLGASTGVVAGRGTNAADEAAPTSISSRPIDEIAAAGVIPDATAPTTTPGEAPIVTPTVKIKKVSYKTTGRKVNKNEKFEATVTLESGETVKFYTGKRRKRDDPSLAADTANQLNPTEVGIGDVRPFAPDASYAEANVSPEPVDVSTVRMGDVPFAPDASYAEANVSPEPVDVSRVGMDDVKFMPRGTTTAQPTLPLEAAARRAEVRPAEMETEADAFERAEAEAKKRIIEAEAEADRRAEAEAAAAARAQTKPATTIKPGKAIWVSKDYDYPVDVVDEPPQAAPDGTLYQAVLAPGATEVSRVPLDQLRQEPEAATTAAQGDLFAAPQDATQAAPKPAPQATAQGVENDGQGAAVDPAEAGASVPGGAPRVGEGQGAASDGQAAEVITTSGTGGLASDMQSPVAAGATGGTEPNTLAGAPLKGKKKTTPNKALKAYLAALSDYFAPGNIVETALGGKDRVLSLTINADNIGSVTVEAVKKENGQWVSVGERPRTYGGMPPKDKAGNYIPPFERAKPVDEVAADATNQAEVAALEKGDTLTNNTSGMGDTDNGYIYVVHGGSDFDQIDFSFSGTGEPGNIRPLGKGLYTFVLDPDDPNIAKNAIDVAKRYATKYGRGKKTLHVFRIPKSVSTFFNGPRDINVEGYPKPIGGLGGEPEDKLAIYRAHRDNEPTKTDPAWWEWSRKKNALYEDAKNSADLRMENLPIGLTEAAINNPSIATRIGKFSLDTPTSDILTAVNDDVQSIPTTEKTATDVGLNMAAVTSASALDKPLSANTRAFLEAGDLKGALLSLSKETKNPILKALAKAFARLVGTTRVKVLYPGDPAKNIGSNRGVFWQASAKGDPERQNIIYLNGQTGMTAHVLMHEMAHAVTANVINNPNLPITRQLQDLLNAVRKQVATPGAFGYSYELQGLTNLSEFVADAYGRVAFGAQDNGLRDLMNNTLFTNIKYETNELPLTNFERFKEIIGNFFRGLVGMPSKPYPRRKITNEVRTTETGLDRFHQIMDNLLSPAPQILPGKIYNAAVANPLIGRNVLDNAGRVPTWSPSAASRMYDFIRERIIPDWLRNFALSLQQIDWIADFSRKALPVIDEIKSIFDRRQGESARLQKIVSQLPERYSVLAKANPAGFKRYIGILDTATRNQVDITKPRNTYRDDAGKLFIWDKLSTEMRAIDPDGKFREAYNIHIALNDSIRQEWFNAVTLQVNQTTEDPAERTALRDKLMAQLLESGIIDPYFPLMREGKYWVSYVQTETTSRPPTAPGVGTKEALFAPEAVVSTFKSIGAARAFIAELNNAKLPDGRPAAVEITQEPFIMDFAKGYDKSVPLEFVQGAIKILDEIVPEASQREAGRAAIIEMFTRMSPAYSAMAQFRSRKEGGRAGAMGYESPIGNVTEPGEYIAALQNRLAGTVNAIVNSKFVPELEAAKSRLRAQAENAQKDPTNTLADKIAINATAKELEKRISFARNPTSSRVAYHARGLTFLWTLGALPAATINVFFQLPMVVIPQLLGRHSLRSIIRALNTARMISQSSGISQLVQEPGQADPTQVKELENWGSLENYYTVDAAGNFILRTDRKIPASLRADLEDLAPLAQYMSRNGMLGTTIAQSELSGMGDVASRIYRFSGLPLQYAERLTRQSTSISAFLLERDKIRSAQGKKDYKLTPEQISDAVKYAVDTTELTNGTVGILTGPSIATSGLGSVLLMYKRYALSMLRFITNGVRRSLTKITPDMTPEQVADAKMERKIARYQLASMIGSTAIFAGIQGLPFFGEATTILDMMFTDDDEEDFKTLAQKSLQEPLYSGLVNYLTGAEVASRISMSGLVFRESPIKKDQPMLYDAFEMFGGPVLGTYLNVQRGFDLLNDGEVYRGIEAMVPSSIRAFMRAGRYIEAGGAETMRGDQITPLDSWDVAVQLLGYTPEAVIRTQEAVGREKRITEAIRSEKNQLYKRFNLALVDGDYEEVRQVQQEMAEFMREHPELGGFDLKASVRGFRQRSQDMVGGVYIPKPFQPGVRESLDEYGRELPQ